MSNTSPRSLFLKRRGRGSASGQRTYSSGVKSSVSIKTSPPSLNLPYRKKQLSRLVGKRRIGNVLSEHTDEDGALIFRQACKLGLEGIVSKRLSAPYRSGARIGSPGGRGPRRCGRESAFAKTRRARPGW
jgi:hypothetical protein